MKENENNKTITWIVVVGLILLGAIWYFASNISSTPAPSTENTAVEILPNPAPLTATPVGESATTSSTTSVSIKTTTIVTYGVNGFSPSTITINNGDSVTFKNESNNDMWVASNPHPAHTAYSGTSIDQHCPDTSGVAFDQCAAGITYTFTFTKTGTWGYHNHRNSADKGTIIVQ